MLNLSLIIIGLVLNIICVWCITLLINKEKMPTAIQYFKYVSGAFIGIGISFFCKPFCADNIVVFGLFGGVFSQSLVIFFLTVKQSYKENTIIDYYDGGTPERFFITGDKHRNFDRVKAFCRDMKTRRKDVLIVLGDAGFNYYDDERDDKLKAEISALNITLFCLHGNKENRPQKIPVYCVAGY